MALPDVLIQVLMGFVATAGFAILFNVPRHMLLLTGLIGAAGHTLRIVLRGFGVSNELASFCGALTVGLVGYWSARHVHTPRLIFTVTGIIAMVPGIPAYEVIVYFNQGDILDGLQSAVRATLLAGAIAAGLSTARILTETEWTRH